MVERSRTPGRSVDNGTHDAPQYVLLQSRAARGAAHTMGAVLGLIGPAIVVVGLIGAGWPALLAGAVLAAGGIPFAVVMIRGTVRSTRRARLLRSEGIVATATITSVTPDVDEDMGVLLGLRVSGPGLEPFVDTVRSEPGPGLAVGGSVGALVDPARGRYTLDSPPVRSGPFYV